MAWTLLNQEFRFQANQIYCRGMDFLHILLGLASFYHGLPDAGF